MQIVNVKINELVPATYNPRRADAKKKDELKASIKEFGIVDPIIVNSAENRKNIVIGGHFRLMVAKEMGFEELPVVYVDISDEKKEKELNLRLNKNNGDWDWEALANEFNTDELLTIGFTKGELGLLEEGLVDRDASQLPKHMDSYIEGTVKQVVLYFDNENYVKTLERLKALMEKKGHETHTDVFMAALTQYENT